MTSTLGIVTLSSKYEEAFTRGLAKAAPSYGLKVVRFTPFDLKAGFKFDTRSNLYEWSRICRSRI
ncbi:hypothetical protein [Bacillus pumilus]|uniref:hypothetical protein n=1 Tax=Bacillus pumilus TaxID=1408 RepID=UPI003CF5BF13